MLTHGRVLTFFWNCLVLFTQNKQHAIKNFCLFLDRIFPQVCKECLWDCDYNDISELRHSSKLSIINEN